MTTPLPLPRALELVAPLPQVPDWTAPVPNIPVLEFPDKWIPIIPKYVTANFTASAALAHNSVVQAKVTPNATATATLTAQTTFKVMVAANFTASGKLSAIADENGRITAEIDIEAELTVKAGPLVKPAFAGSGALSAATTPRYIRPVALTATGTLAAVAIPKAKAFPAFAGSGALTADVKKKWTDTFNRADTTGEIGPLWTKHGTNSRILTNSYATNTTGGERGIISVDELYTDNGYIEVVIGGAHAPSNVAVSIAGRVAADGSTSVMANLFSGAVYIARMNGTFTGLTPTDIASNTSVGVASGDTVRLSWNGTLYTLTKNGTTIASGTSGIISTGAAYRRCGLVVRRTGTTNSASINQVTAGDL